jgi:hypothetical protein
MTFSFQRPILVLSNNMYNQNTEDIREYFNKYVSDVVDAMGIPELGTHWGVI